MVREADARAKDAASQEESKQAQRLEDMARRAMRRLQQLGLAMGWSAWHEMWEEKRRQMNLMRGAGARLMRPQLAAAYSHWRDDWWAAGAEAMKRKSMSLQEQAADANYRAELVEKELAKLQESAKKELNRARE